MLSPERIVEVARQAANERGYAVFADYNEDLRREICAERTLEPTQAGFYPFTIKSVLKSAGWRSEEGHPGRPARFFPPA